jgi:hypothetical protein
MPTIEETAVSIASAGLIQNLGPDAVYIGGTAVTTETGFRVSSGEALAVGTATSMLYAVSDGTSDVRILNRATGIFTFTPPPE